MAGSARGGTFVAILFILIAFLLAGGAFYVYYEERMKNVALTQELDEIKSRQMATEAKLEDSRQEVTSLRVRLQESRDKIEELTKGLAEEQSVKLQSEAAIKTMKQELEDSKKLRSELESKLDSAQTQFQRVQVQVKDLEARKRDLEAKVKTMEEERIKMSDVELGTIVVSPEPQSSSVSLLQQPGEETSTTAAVQESPYDGKILVVNRDYNFAVLNIGSKDGVRVGSMFSVHRNNQYLGDIKVEKIHDTMSAAGFVSPQLRDKVREGDKVILAK